MVVVMMRRGEMVRWRWGDVKHVYRGSISFQIPISTQHSMAWQWDSPE